MNKTFYITTPIYYVNDVPHIGHAYTTIAADTAARYHRLSGDRVYFLTGTDEHGQKVQQAAAARGKSPQEHVDEMVHRFRNLWVMLNISNNDFIRTTEARHKTVVGDVLKSLLDKGEIYSAVYEGWYCLPDERFWTEKDLKEGKCPDCGRPVEKISETNYFFRMGKYQQRLIDHIQKNPGFIRPESRRNEVLGFLDKPLNDLCISRPRTRLEWGIPLPFAQDYVTYVWFDALVNYISAPGFGIKGSAYEAFWPADFHLIGKDILTTHSVYWSTMLMAAGIPLPKAIFAHGWWTVDGQKMSKSVGNVVDPYEMVERFGEDAFRYFLLREVPFGNDGDFSVNSLIGRINADLADDLGNLRSRSVGLAHRLLKGLSGAPAPEGADASLKEAHAKAFPEYREAMESLNFNRALVALWDFIRAVNKYVDHSAPWVVAKAGDTAKVEAIIYNCLDALRMISIMAFPVMPRSAEKMWKNIGLPGGAEQMKMDDANRWGLLAPNSPVGALEALFPKIDLKAATATAAPKPAAVEKPAETLPEIGIEEFLKTDLRAGKILSAEKLPKSNKLVIMKVDLGGGDVRQVVAGIGKAYEPEALVGKKVLVVANLKPAKLMGVESRGMLLAATDADGLRLVSFDGEVKEGTKIK
jgi:methionyl-tRNA synthetase